MATSIDQEWEGAKVNLMTMHAAKDKFDAVFTDGGRIVSSSKSLEEKGDFALEEEDLLTLVLQELKRLFIFRNKKSLSWRLMMRFSIVNEIPETIEKNEMDLDKNNDDFDFNQDSSIEFDEEFEVLVGKDLKKRYLDGKIKRLRSF